MTDKTARLVIQQYPVLVLSNEWLEELYCAACGQNRWYHVVRDPSGGLSLSPAKAELWQQVAHVDPVRANPTVSEYSLKQALRLANRRRDGRRFFD